MNGKKSISKVLTDPFNFGSNINAVEAQAEAALNMPGATPAPYGGLAPAFFYLNAGLYDSLQSGFFCSLSFVYQLIQFFGNRRILCGFTAHAGIQFRGFVYR